jgi:predicted GNAT family acetyltransferase
VIVAAARSSAQNAIRDDRANGRFVLEHGGPTSELVYDHEPGRLILIHTEVPEAFRRRGIGGRLVRAALERARADHLTVVPWCRFVRRWLIDHPDAASDVAIDWTPPPPRTPAAGG